MPFRKLIRWLRGARPPAAPAGPARDFGALWSAIQEIAREENPEIFDRKSASQHAAESLEGKKDVERWLDIYRMRRDPKIRRRFPDHHHRHRGLCLVPRHWPSGTLWEAFHEETLIKARVPAQPTREALIGAIDRWLGGESGAAEISAT